MTSLITDIAHAIDESDTILNGKIQDFLSGPFYYGPPVTPGQWRIENYSILRAWAYPPLAEKADAEVKINSGDADLIAEGTVQLGEYYADCLEVKARFPKG